MSGSKPLDTTVDKFFTLVDDESNEQNDIFGDTNCGLNSISLCESLEQDSITEPSFLEDDFQIMANQLLAGQESGEYLLQTVRPTRTVRSVRRGGVLRAFQTRMHDSQDEADSVLVSDSGLSSDASEVISGSNTSVENLPIKRRGGWPKGRKRKPDNKTDIRPPKAPATGYVLFLNEKRKEYKDLPFTEVTKLLGNEWSRLSLNEKTKYLVQAEIERKRYREELRVYRQSEAYKIYLQRKRLKRFQGGHATEESDMDATDEIDDEDNEELYCRSCDQWFQTLHNKKEHLYGRQHLHNANTSSSVGAAIVTNVASSSSSPHWASFDDSSLDAGAKMNSLGHCVSMQQLIVQFTAANHERERELRHLLQRLSHERMKNTTLTQRLTTLNNIRHNLEVQAQSNLNEYRINEQKLLKLLKVTNIFPKPDKK